MRKLLAPTMLAGALALGGCTTGLDGLLGGILGNDTYGSGYDDRNLSRFERAAVEACAQEASRYGRVDIRDVRQTERDIVRVTGRIDNRDRQRDEFSCDFRDDGRIVDFETG